MIKIDITRKSTDITGFSVSGHAETAPHGQDIVCAGISALTQSAVIGLERHLGRSMKLKVNKGRLDMALIEPPDALTGAILETMLLGLVEIANLYPQSVLITEHRR